MDICNFNIRAMQRQKLRVEWSGSSMLKGPFSHESAQMICAENQESMSQLDTFLDGFRRPGEGGGEGVEVGGGEGVPSLKEINYSH